MNKDNSNNPYLSTFQSLNVKNTNEQYPQSNIVEIKEIKTKDVPYDEPFLYHGIGLLGFSTATLLLGIRIWNGYPNPKLLTVFGFFLGGLGQLVSAIMCYKYKYYIDGTCYLYFTFNWAITTCYDLFPVYGWMEPLSGRDYGFHNLMGCLFTFVFFLQNLGAPSYITRVSFTTTFISFIFSTIGSFTNSTAVTKIGGIFNIITASLAYYSVVAMTINERYKKVWIPVLDGKKLCQKLD